MIRPKAVDSRIAAVLLSGALHAGFVWIILTTTPQAPVGPRTVHAVEWLVLDAPSPPPSSHANAKAHNAAIPVRAVRTRLPEPPSADRAAPRVPIEPIASVQEAPRNSQPAVPSPTQIIPDVAAVPAGDGPSAAAPKATVATDQTAHHDDHASEAVSETGTANEQAEGVKQVRTGTPQPRMSATASAPGDGVEAAQIIRPARPRGGYQVRPAYPASARREGAQGTTILRVRVQADGRIGEITVKQSAGHPDLDRAAADAVRRWRFEPARTVTGDVAIWVLIPVEFRLDHGEGG